MFRVCFVAVPPFKFPYPPSEDVDLVDFMADRASYLEFPSVLQMLPKPAAICVFSYTNEVVSVDDHSKNSLWVEEGTWAGTSWDESDVHHRYPLHNLPKIWPHRVCHKSC